MTYCKGAFPTRFPGRRSLEGFVTGGDGAGTLEGALGTAGSLTSPTRRAPHHLRFFLPLFLGPFAAPERALLHWCAPCESELQFAVEQRCMYPFGQAPCIEHWPLFHRWQNLLALPEAPRRTVAISAGGRRPPAEDEAAPVSERMERPRRPAVILSAG